MADAPKPEEKKPAPKSLHDKSYEEIVADGQKRAAKEPAEADKATKEVNSIINDQIEESPLVIDKPEEESKPVEKIEKIEEPTEKPVRKAPSTKKIAEVVKESVKATLEAERAQEKEEAKKQAEEKARVEEEEKLTNFVPKWVEEKRTPKDYEEILAEAERKAELKIEAKLRERDQQAEIERAKQAEETKQKEETVKVQNDLVNRQVEDEMNEIYLLDKLPKIKDEGNANDEGIAARNAFFKFGQELNNKRISEGKYPLFPLAVLSYYKPKNPQPAGANAPVVGNQAPAAQDNRPPMKYQDLRRKSFRQILADGVKRATGQG